MPLYLSSSVYIFAALEISLPHPGVVGICGRETVCGYGVAYGEGPTGVPLNSGGVVVWMLNGYYDWNGVMWIIGFYNIL